jgi:anti-sigma factor RsiW
MTSTCVFVHRDLDAFVDGELRGAARMRVFKHLQTCEACAADVEAMRGLGDVLRSSAEKSQPDHAGLAGLAATVISRTKAETDESWAGTMRRATEDWHWLLVGSGSVAATLVVTLILSAMLAFGPKPQRSDSLAAIVVDLASRTSDSSSPGGYLFAEMARPGSDSSDAMTVQVENGSPRASMADLVLVSNSPTNAEVVGALFQAANRQENFCDGVEACRQAAENLSQRVTSAMLASGNPMPAAYAVRKLRLLTSVKAVVYNDSGS